MQLYFDSNFLEDYNKYIINSDYIYLNSWVITNLNYNSIFNFILYNFNQKQDFNDFYSIKTVYTNNILITNFILGHYSFDNLINLLFFNIHIIYYLIIVFTILFI